MLTMHVMKNREKGHFRSQITRQKSNPCVLVRKHMTLHISWIQLFRNCQSKDVICVDLAVGLSGLTRWISDLSRFNWTGVSGGATSLHLPRSPFPAIAGCERYSPSTGIKVVIWRGIQKWKNTSRNACERFHQKPAAWPWTFNIPDIPIEITPDICPRAHAQSSIFGSKTTFSYLQNELLASGVHLQSFQGEKGKPSWLKLRCSATKILGNMDIIANDSNDDLKQFAFLRIKTLQYTSCRNSTYQQQQEEEEEHRQQEQRQSIKW